MDKHPHRLTRRLSTHPRNILTSAYDRVTKKGFVFLSPLLPECYKGQLYSTNGSASDTQSGKGEYVIKCFAHQDPFHPKFELVVDCAGFSRRVRYHRNVINQGPSRTDHDLKLQ